MLFFDFNSKSQRVYIKNIVDGRSSRPASPTYLSTGQAHIAAPRARNSVLRIDKALQVPLILECIVCIELSFFDNK